MMPVKVAVVQAPPVLLDRAATIDRMLDRMDEVAAAGAGLVVFPEAYVPGYPTWVWRLKPGGDMALAGEIHARLREQAIALDRGDLAPGGQPAAKVGIPGGCGMHEICVEVSGT